MNRRNATPAQHTRDHNWDAHYQALVTFQDSEGHCNVPTRGTFTRLGRWLNKQRTRKNKGHLSPDRVGRLDSLGVVWDVLAAQWNESFSALVNYKSQTGHCEVPRGYAPDPRLATWLGVQRRQHQLGTLLPDRAARLAALGVEWEPHAAAWERRLDSLAAYWKRHGNCDVPSDYPADPALPTWIVHQRAAKRRGTLAFDRINRLEALGFCWTPREAEEQSIIDRLTHFHSQHGHCNVPETHQTLGAVGQWLTAQRMARRRGRLSQERIAKLDALGISWDPHADAWNERYEALRQFHATKGHCEAPRTYRPDLGLSGWKAKQRSDRKSGALSNERKARLDALGFVWDRSNRSAPSKHRQQDGTQSPSWDEHYQQLKAFTREVGHCNVPARYLPNLQLGRWLARQRDKWRRNDLGPVEVSLLGEIGVVWDPGRALDDQKFSEIEAYRKLHGHGNVPESHPSLGAVGEWLTRKRMAKRRGKLAASVASRLEALAVEWDPHEASWLDQFHLLRQFIGENGHIEIAGTTTAVRTLASWMSIQRTSKRKGTLSQQRLTLLDSIGFTWDPAEHNLESMFSALQAFKSKEGHCDVRYDNTEFPGLGAWLSAQRSAKKRGTLDPERLARLEALGVSWRPKWEGKARIQGFSGKCCHYCRKPFTLTHGNSKYCSPECYLRASTEHDKTTGCHIWKKALDSSGRPHAHWGRRRRKAHIMAFELAGGTLPRGMVLRHRCNSSRCCNPDHLVVGTHAENMQDKAESGITAGENCHNATIDNSTACEIYSCKGVEKSSSVATRLNVPIELVRRIWSGLSYARATGAQYRRTGRLRGEDNPSSQCDNETALLVFAEKAKGIPSAAAAARKYGISETTARNIWSGRSYSDITGARKKHRHRKYKTKHCVVCSVKLDSSPGNGKYCSWKCCLSSHIRTGRSNNCWPWVRGAKSGRYGQLSFRSQRAMAHIVAFDLAYPLLAIARKQEQLTVSHSCHNTLCCNPAHLSLATIEENSSANTGRPDMSGEANHQTKTPERIARAIKQLVAEGLENRAIVDRIMTEYGVAVSTMIVTDIRRGHAWRHLPTV
jgi:hypothetical protein